METLELARDNRKSMRGISRVIRIDAGCDNHRCSFDLHTDPNNVNDKVPGHSFLKCWYGEIIDSSRGDHIENKFWTGALDHAVLAQAAEATALPTTCIAPEASVRIKVCGKASLVKVARLSRPCTRV